MFISFPPAISLSGISLKVQLWMCRKICLWGWLIHHPWRRKWQPTPVFLPGKSQRWGAWQASVHGVTKSWTWLNNFHLLPVLFLIIAKIRTKKNWQLGSDDTNKSMTICWIMTLLTEINKIMLPVNVVKFNFHILPKFLQYTLLLKAFPFKYLPFPTLQNCHRISEVTYVKALVNSEVLWTDKESLAVSSLLLAYVVGSIWGHLWLLERSGRIVK